MKLHALLAASCIAASCSVHANNPLQPVEVSDQELSQLRGRFIMPGRIVEFGVTMNSVWENANGQVLGGKVNMQMKDGMFQPVFNVSSVVASNGEQNVASAASGQIHGGNGLTNVSGISQSARSAGDFNSVYNDVSINVRHGNTASAIPQGSPSLGETSASLANVGSVQIAPGNGGFKIAIDALGQGTSLQQIASGSLQQHTNITGSSNAVKSLTSIDLMLRDTGTADQMRANWNQLGALRPTGY